MTPKAFMVFFLDLLSSSVEVNSTLAPAIQRLRCGVSPAGLVFKQRLIEAGGDKIQAVCCANMVMKVSRVDGAVVHGASSGAGSTTSTAAVEPFSGVAGPLAETPSCR
jgi:hypothetical protein